MYEIEAEFWKVYLNYIIECLEENFTPGTWSLFEYGSGAVELTIYVEHHEMMPTRIISLLNRLDRIGVNKIAIRALNTIGKSHRVYRVLPDPIEDMLAAVAKRKWLPLAQKWTFYDYGGKYCSVKELEPSGVPSVEVELAGREIQQCNSGRRFKVISARKNVKLECDFGDDVRSCELTHEQMKSILDAISGIPSHDYLFEGVNLLRHEDIVCMQRTKTLAKKGVWFIWRSDSHSWYVDICFPGKRSYREVSVNGTKFVEAINLVCAKMSVRLKEKQQYAIKQYGTKLYLVSTRRGCTVYYSGIPFDHPSNAQAGPVWTTNIKEATGFPSLRTVSKLCTRVFAPHALVTYRMEGEQKIQVVQPFGAF